MLRIFFALIHLGFAIQGREQIPKLTHGLRRTQKKIPARVQRIVEKGNDLFLQFRAHINEHITTADQVELGKRGILDHVLFGKNQHVANVLADAV